MRTRRAATSKGEDRLVVVGEVQQIQQWEGAVASLNGEPRTRVIISGSNASLLSGELATRIAGRCLTLQVFPLTLAEFGQLHAKRVADFLSAPRRSASVDTILNYLAYLDEAFLLNTVRRYDLKGKKHLETNAKYYLGNIGLRNGVVGYREATLEACWKTWCSWSSAVAAIALRSAQPRGEESTSWRKTARGGCTSR